MNASEICQEAAKLISNQQLTNYTCIAQLWEGYLYAREQYAKGGEPCWKLTALDVLNMMELLKVARRLTGQHNIDDYIDAAGYAACAGEIASNVHDR